LHIAAIAAIPSRAQREPRLAMQMLRADINAVLLSAITPPPPFSPPFSPHFAITAILLIIIIFAAGYYVSMLIIDIIIIYATLLRHYIIFIIVHFDYYFLQIDTIFISRFHALAPAHCLIIFITPFHFAATC
jgi:hypothetical protein